MSTVRLLFIGIPVFVLCAGSLSLVFRWGISNKLFLTSVLCALPAIFFWLASTATPNGTMEATIGVFLSLPITIIGAILYVFAISKTGIRYIAIEIAAFLVAAVFVTTA